MRALRVSTGHVHRGCWLASTKTMDADGTRASSSASYSLVQRTSWMPLSSLACSCESRAPSQMAICSFVSRNSRISSQPSSRIVMTRTVSSWSTPVKIKEVGILMQGKSAVRIRRKYVVGMQNQHTAGRQAGSKLFTVAGKKEEGSGSYLISTACPAFPACQSCIRTRGNLARFLVVRSSSDRAVSPLRLSLCHCPFPAGPPPVR